MRRFLVLLIFLIGANVWAEVKNHPHDWGVGWITVTLADGRTYLERRCKLDNCDAVETK